MTKDLLPLGLHFGLDEDTYHADPGLGSSIIKKLVVDPTEAQFETLKGNEELSEKDVIKFGKAVHARVLEGETSLHTYFGPELETDQHESALNTIADLKEYLALFQEPGETGLYKLTKPELIKKVLEIDPEQPIVDVIKRDWQQKNEGKIILTARRWDQVKLAAKWMQDDPLLSAVMKNGTFIGGAPEVSVIYEVDGIRHKGRFDMLLRHAIVDVKTFAPFFGGDIVQAALKAIDRMRYDLQEAWYRLAWHWCKEQFEAGTLPIHGTEPFPDFLTQCFDREDIIWLWVFVKSTGSPQPLVVEWRAQFARDAAMSEVLQAVETYKLRIEEFGTDKQWPPRNPAVVFEDTDIPAYMFGGRG